MSLVTQLLETCPQPALHLHISGTTVLLSSPDWGALFSFFLFFEKKKHRRNKVRWPKQQYQRNLPSYFTLRGDNISQLTFYVPLTSLTWRPTPSWETADHDLQVSLMNYQLIHEPPLAVTDDWRLRGPAAVTSYWTDKNQRPIHSKEDKEGQGETRRM